MKTFPTIQDLSSASEDVFLIVFSLFLRKFNLFGQDWGIIEEQECYMKELKYSDHSFYYEQYVMSHFHGQLPNNVKDLLTIKGIGDYTAGIR